MPSALVYKICTAAEWSEAERQGHYAGSAVDAKDGFIHFSIAGQVAETASRHFAGQSDLVLVAVDPARLPVALKWEESRGGALFPHLYGSLPTGAAVDIQPFPLMGDGTHSLPCLPGSANKGS